MRGTRVIDQDAPHDPSTDCEKMSAVLPVCVFLPHQLQISFVDKRGAVEGVILPLTPQLPVGDLAQLRVDQRSELVDCGGISGSPRFEQFCDFSGSHVIELSRNSQRLVSALRAAVRKPISNEWSDARHLLIFFIFCAENRRSRQGVLTISQVPPKRQSGKRRPRSERVVGHSCSADPKHVSL